MQFAGLCKMPQARGLLCKKPTHRGHHREAQPWLRTLGWNRRACRALHQGQRQSGWCDCTPQTRLPHATLVRRWVKAIGDGCRKRTEWCQGKVAFIISPTLVKATIPSAHGKLVTARRSQEAGPVPAALLPDVRRQGNSSMWRHSQNRWRQSGFNPDGVSLALAICTCTSCLSAPSGSSVKSVQREPTATMTHINAQYRQPMRNENPRHTKFHR